MSTKTGIQWTALSGRALGVMKGAAKRAGVSFDEYRSRCDAGEKYCYACRAWHKRSAFGVDLNRWDGLAAVCRDRRNAINRDRHTPIPRDLRRYGPSPNPARDGDKVQARQRVNVLVRTGKMPPPALLPCADCGHVGDAPRHEYDHFLGYEAEHHLDVQAVCVPCHRRRDAERRHCG